MMIFMVKLGHFPFENVSESPVSASAIGGNEVRNVTGVVTGIFMDFP